MLIGVLGKKYHGKDTIADYLCQNYNFTKLTLAEPLKDICKTLFQFTDQQLNSELKDVIDLRYGVTPRKIMQYIGTDILRNDIQRIIPNIQQNLWVNILINKIKSLEGNIVISDVRCENEILRIREEGGIIIKVVRPSVVNDDEHETEKNIDHFEGDYEVENENLLDLYGKIDEIIMCLKV